MPQLRSTTSVLLACALLTACAHKPEVLTVLPTVSKCPAFPVPPSELMESPAHFLPTSD
jgi:uncharacterized lipoprotein YajG